MKKTPFKVGVKGKFHEFHDTKYDCKLYIQNTCGHKNGLIDFKNNGEKNYNMRDIVKMYSLARPSAKQLTTAIHFTNKKLSGGNLAYNRRLKIQYDRNGVEFPNWGENHVVMGKDALRTDIAGHSTQKTLFHEMGHSIDLNNENGIHISDMEEYANYVKEEGYTEYGLRYYYDEGGLSEDVADTISMIDCSILKDKSVATILLPDKSVIGYDEFMERFPKKVELVKKQLEELDEIYR